MNRSVPRNFVVIFSLFFVFFLLSAPGVLTAQNIAKGNIVGFIFAKDGTPPLEGAVIKFKSLVSGAVYESSKSDNLGIFKVQGVETGLYTYGVMTERGSFNADNTVGLRIGENETAKLSIAVDPYDKGMEAAVSELYKDQAAGGESFVGTIADFDSGSGMARVQVVKGLIRVKDRIHAKGSSTNFYQEVAALHLGDGATKQILMGQTGDMKLERSAQRGDFVYVVRNRKVFPFFLTPAGVAAVIAGNTAVTYGYTRIKDEGDPVSASRNE